MLRGFQSAICADMQCYYAKAHKVSLAKAFQSAIEVVSICGETGQRNVASR